MNKEDYIQVLNNSNWHCHTVDLHKTNIFFRPLIIRVCNLENLVLFRMNIQANPFGSELLAMRFPMAEDLFLIPGTLNIISTYIICDRP